VRGIATPAVRGFWPSVMEIDDGIAAQYEVQQAQEALWPRPSVCPIPSSLTKNPEPVSKICFKTYSKNHSQGQQVSTIAKSPLPIAMSTSNTITKYHSLDKESLEKGETDAFIHDTDADSESQQYQIPPKLWNRPWPWMVATFVLSLLSLSLFLRPLGKANCPARSYETGFATDLGLLFPSERVR
jgi:hypothetical protein